MFCSYPVWFLSFLQICFLIPGSHGTVDEALQELESQTGDVLVKGDADYDTRKLIMNAACTDEPAIIVVPKTDLDVSIALKAAKKSGLPLSVRSGGHSYTCNSIKDGSLHIDMRGMSSVQLVQDSDSPTGLVAMLDAGATWGSVLQTVPPTSYSYPHGQCRSVGVAGYLLGGGVNWLGTYNKYGYGAENVMAMRAVLSDGRIADVTPQTTQIIHPTQETITHTTDNNLFFALRGAGSSYGVVTQFKYIVHQTPETLPAILLAWADESSDLQAIKAAGQESSDYSITISEEFTRDFWQNPQVGLIYKFLFPPIMTVLRRIGKRLHGVDSYPVFLTVTDITPQAGRTTSVTRAANYVKSKGVRLVMRNDFMINIFHIFAEVLYEANINEQEQWQPGQYYLSSLNFGSLAGHQAFEDVFFNDPHFGNKRSDFLKSVTDGCDYCFWMIHYRNRQYQTPVSALNCCPFSDTATQTTTSNTEQTTTLHTSGFSSCQTTSGQACVFPFTHQGVTHTACTYQGGYPTPWCSTQTDTSGVHVVGSYGDCDLSGGLCTEESVSSPSTTTTQCQTVSGAVPGLPCVFPFLYNGQVFTGCVTQGFDQPWCSTLTSLFGVHLNGNWGNCDQSVCPMA